MKNKIKAIVISILLLFVFLGIPSLICSYKIVPPGNRGVAVTLGNVSNDLLSEGLHFVTPFITTVHLMSVKQNTISGDTSCFSSDLQTLEISYNILYKLSDANVISLFKDYQGDPYETLVKPRFTQFLKETTSQFKAEEAVKSRPQVRQLTFDKLVNELNGLVTIVDIVLDDISLTDDLERAIEMKQVKEQTALAKQYELQQEVKEAEITVVKAKAEAEAVKIKGEAIQSNPMVLQLEMIRKWNGISPLVVGNTGNILLPLDNINK